MSTSIVKVGVREFREHLPQYLMTASPVAVTRHGETIGFYIPARQHHPDKMELEALQQAAVNLEKLISESRITEEELFAEYRALKHAKEKKKKKVSASKEKRKR